MNKPSFAHRVQFCLNKPWQDDPNGNVPPWFVSFTNDQHDSIHALVNRLEIRGHCFGGDILLPNGKHAKMVTCSESTLTWSNDSDLAVRTTANVRARVSRRENPKRVLVRLFTPWLVRRDPNEPAWRVLTEVDEAVFEERPAHQFDIVGRSFGLRHDFPDPVGPKMHIACAGTISWKGDTAYITTQE